MQATRARSRRGSLDIVAPGPADMPVGAELASMVSAVDVGSADDEQLIEVMVAARRLTSWMQERELAAAGELALRREAGKRGPEFADGRYKSRSGEGITIYAVDEVRLALHLTGNAAAWLIELALELHHRLPRTREALARGDIDLARARVIVSGCGETSDEIAAKVEAKVLPGAGRKTTGELRAQVSRAVIAADPAAAERRRRRSEAGRDVIVRDTGEGTADLTGCKLPAAAAIAAANRLNGIAKAIKSRGDDRRIGNIRADVMLALLLGVMPSSLAPYTGPAPSGQASAPSGRAPDSSGRASAPSGQAPDSSGQASAQSGPAPDPSDQAAAPSGRAAAPDGVATSGRSAEPGTTTSEECDDAGPGRGARAAEPEADGPEQEVSDAGLPPAPDVRDVPDDPAGEPGGGDHEPWHRRYADFTDPTEDDWSPMPVGAELGALLGGRVGTVHLTVPLTTYLGLAAAPGHIAGYGPVLADTARLLARQATSAKTRWCLTIVGDDGEPLVHGNTGYRPAPMTRAWVEIRDQTCRFPTCRRAAHRCDLDHTVPYHLGGPTCPCNLAPLCRRHHRLKERAGWQLHHTSPGVLFWVTPTGHRHRVRPDPYPSD